MDAKIPVASYDPTFFEPLFAIEDRHFWFRARNRVITTVVRQVVAGLKPGYRVLEVGCGTGSVLRVLTEACRDGTVVGMDLFAEGLRYARRRGARRLVQGDMHAVPFGQPFEAIGLFDVLEHLPDDGQVLRELHRLLAPGGTLILTVPAHPSLWSYFDEAACHCRRYEPADLTHALADAGYCVEYLTPYMMGLMPLLWLRRKFLSRWDHQAAKASRRTRALANQELRIIPVVNELLTILLALESHLIARHRRLPIGTSLLALARRETGHGSSIPSHG